ncbi:(2Fe-2S)-binding protein [Microbacterium trichothecenolyticum]|uniref:(2Fe-2S)-binding protein n=1 Tax=Microbacterium trichothecenolyticum TaxID=69370 RepID=A0ABU0TU79_MICTR|nr:(2Fe-2S)-binding protein [Microbacterium trichothecenolyticum]MDQ1122509.1 hypothetical protein [Microbacterium trichothecenolyticum]
MSAVDRERAAESAHFSFDGESVPFVAGQSVGAALMAHGITSWRTTRVQQRPRGLFCGIGVCFDCLLTVDDRRSQRACLVPAVAGARVLSADPDAPLVAADAAERPCVPAGEAPHGDDAVSSPTSREVS